MKREISAGGVVVRKKDGKWEVLLITDMNNELTFPKGIIEESENSKEAAIREIGEEVGISSLQLVSELKPIAYEYKRGQIIQKTVHYFLFLTDGKQRLIPQDNEGITRAEWISFEKAYISVGYPKTNKKILLEAQNTLLKHS